MMAIAERPIKNVTIGSPIETPDTRDKGLPRGPRRFAYRLAGSFCRVVSEPEYLRIIEEKPRARSQSDPPSHHIFLAPCLRASHRSGDATEPLTRRKSSARLFGRDKVSSGSHASIKRGLSRGVISTY